MEEDMHFLKCDKQPWPTVGIANILKKNNALWIITRII